LFKHLEGVAVRFQAYPCYTSPAILPLKAHMPLEKAPETSHILAFGDFLLELRTGELRTNGHHTILQDKPFQILVALLERPGEMVTREELIHRLWPVGTFVDFNLGLNKAVNRLREVLEDTADNPIFIETIPRRGYRFIAPVRVDLSVLDPASSAEVKGRAESLVVPAAGSKVNRKWNAGLLALGLVFVVACWLIYRGVFPPALRVNQIIRLTNSGRFEPWGRITSDGSRLFFLDRDGDHWNTRQVSVSGGESMPFGPSGRDTKVLAVSPDQSEILFVPFTSISPDLPLWSMPIVGGASRRVGEILVDAVAYSPDGMQIAFVNNSGLFVANRDGSQAHQLAALPECWAVAWSPDGKILRFDSHGRHLWQIDATGRNLHPFLPSWAAWDGRWTADGSYYTFTASQGGREELWAVRDVPAFPWLHPAPTQLTFPPLTLGGALPSRDGHSIYVSGALSRQVDVVRFDPTSHQFKPVLPGFNVEDAAFSPNHQWMLYTTGNQLWRSRPDGSDRLQLAKAPAPSNIYGARWSPDSKHVLFEGINDDGKTTIYQGSSDGEPSSPPLPPGRSRHWPDWSPDGQTMAFSLEEEVGDTPAADAGLYLFDFRLGSITKIPGSNGLTVPRFSPDGRLLAALSGDGSMMKLLDLKTHRWSEVARGKVFTFPVWSADSVLYFEDLLGTGEPVYRFQPGSSSPQRVYTFETILQAGAMRCALLAFAPDGALLVQVNRGGGDIYSLSVAVP
jgi:DNA-binding winged helix-turn-helix (wHTH) protein/Tol biopolymer transport system component